MNTTLPPALCHLELVYQGAQVQRLAFADEPRVPSTPEAQALIAQLARYGAGEQVDFSAVDVAAEQGSTFQQKVWQAIRAIPYGEVRTYAELAVLSNHPRAVRAVGNAVAANPAVIVIPCHRVIRSNGTIGNYGGGQLRKLQLLSLEQRGLQVSQDD